MVTCAEARRRPCADWAIKKPPRKPLVERRRRARIGAAVSALRQLLLEAGVVPPAVAAQGTPKEPCTPPHLRHLTPEPRQYSNRRPKLETVHVLEMSLALLSRGVWIERAQLKRAQTPQKQSLRAQTAQPYRVQEKRPQIEFMEKPSVEAAGISTQSHSIQRLPVSGRKLEPVCDASDFIEGFRTCLAEVMHFVQTTEEVPQETCRALLLRLGLPPEGGGGGRDAPNPLAVLPFDSLGESTLRTPHPIGEGESFRPAVGEGAEYLPPLPRDVLRREIRLLGPSTRAVGVARRETDFSPNPEQTPTVTWRVVTPVGGNFNFGEAPREVSSPCLDVCCSLGPPDPPQELQLQTHSARVLLRGRCDSSPLQTYNDKTQLWIHSANTPLWVHSANTPSHVYCADTQTQINSANLPLLSIKDKSVLETTGVNTPLRPFGFTPPLFPHSSNTSPGISSASTQPITPPGPPTSPVKDERPENNSQTSSKCSKSRTHTSDDDGTFVPAGRCPPKSYDRIHWKKTLASHVHGVVTEEDEEALWRPW